MSKISRKIRFSNHQPEYFHFNFDYQVHPLFPELDWMMLNFKINKISIRHHIELQAFVMMTTHCHLLFKCTTKSENYFTSELLQELHLNELEHSLVEPINNLAQYLNTYKYVYRNPVEAGLTQQCENYQYSSLHGLLGKSMLSTLVIDPLSVTQNPIKVLNWLNSGKHEPLFYELS